MPRLDKGTGRPSTEAGSVCGGDGGGKGIEVEVPENAIDSLFPIALMEAESSFPGKINGEFVCGSVDEPCI